MYNIIRLGTDCNQNCMFCFNKEMQDFDLSTEQAKKSIYDLSKIQKKMISFAGGEPTIRKDLCDLVSYAKKAGFQTICIQTNGVRLENRQSLKSLVDNGLNNLYFSLHSHLPEISDSITGVSGNFAKTVAAIKNAVTFNLFIEVNHVINSKNYKDIISFVKFVESISKSIKIEFSFVIPFKDTTINEQILPKLSSMEPYFLEALHYCSSNKINFVISSCSVPYCFCGDYIEKTAEFDHMVQLRKNESGVPDYEKINGMSSEMRGANLWNIKRKKVAKCKECIFNELCNGPWIGYLDTYGDSEIKPILDTRIFNRQYLGCSPNSNTMILLDAKNIDPALNIKNNSRIFFRFKEDELNLETGEKIVDFIESLNQKGIRFQIINPLPRCLFGINFFEISKKFNIPRNCKECYKLYSLDKDRMIVFCDILKDIKGPKQDYMRDRKQVYEYFDAFYKQLEPFDKCKSCIYLLRNQCKLCNRERKINVHD